MLQQIYLPAWQAKSELKVYTVQLLFYKENIVREHGEQIQLHVWTFQVQYFNCHTE